MSDPVRTLGLLGRQLKLVLQAFQAPDTTLFCAVRGETTSAATTLFREGERSFLVFDSMPGSVDVKAIGIDAENLFVELAPLDYMALKGAEALKGIRIDSRGIWLGRKRLAKLETSSAAVAREHGARVLWTIPWSTLAPGDLERIIQALDAIDDQGAYLESLPPDDEMVARSAPTSITLVQRMDLQLQLIQTQIPILSATVRQKQLQTVTMRLDMDLETCQQFESWLRRDPNEAINTYLLRDSSVPGQNRLTKLITFALVRVAREGAAARGETLTWPVARRLVRKQIYELRPSP